MPWTLPDPAGPQPLSDPEDILLDWMMDQRFQPIAHGVTGLIRIHDEGRTLEIAGIRATHPGRGDVSRYLDWIPARMAVFVPFVVSDRLRGMLERRGYVLLEGSDNHYVRLPQ